jgi:hypothetical protein
MVMVSSAMCFAAGGLELKSSYPEDGQKNTSIENLGVKLQFSNPINSDEAKATDESLFAIYDEEGKAIPIKVLFSDKSDGVVLVVADIDEGFVAKNNSDYKLVISGDLVDNEGNTLGADKTITFRTYNQRVNNMVNMAMMFVMFGGIMFLTVRQNNKKGEEEAETKEEPKEAFNPYKEAKRTGKTVEEVMAEQAKKEEKLAKKKARRKKSSEPVHEKKIENCAELLNNVYHVHAPAPVSKEDRSIEALRAMRKAEAKAAKAEKEAQYAKKSRKR